MDGSFSSWKILCFSWKILCFSWKILCFHGKSYVLMDDELGVPAFLGNRNILQTSVSVGSLKTCVRFPADLPLNQFGDGLNIVL